MRRGLFIAAAATALASVAIGTAQAATVSHYYYGVTFDAAPGERNTVTWTADSFFPLDVIGSSGPADIVISDATAKVTAGLGCKQLGPRAVLCEDAQGFITLGDGDDSFEPLSSNDYGDRYRGDEFSVNGGPGNDRLSSTGLGEGAASLYGGDGNDVLITGGFALTDGGAGNDKIVLESGYSNDPSFGSALTCGPGIDTVIAPKGDPLPADCEKQILLPRALGGH